MTKNPTWLLVVAGHIRDDAGSLLLQQGLPHKRHAGLWEFPGGKVETHETPRFALCREIADELGIELAEDALVPVGFAEEAGAKGGPPLVLFLYTCLRWRGQPEARKGQGLGAGSHPKRPLACRCRRCTAPCLPGCTPAAAPFANLMAISAI